MRPIFFIVLEDILVMKTHYKKHINVILMFVVYVNMYNDKFLNISYTSGNNLLFCSNTISSYVKFNKYFK